MVAFGVALSEVAESYRCRVLSTGQTWPRVEGTEERHAEGEGGGRDCGSIALPGCSCKEEG